MILVGLGLLTGIAITVGLQAKAQTSGAAATQAPARQFDPAKGGHIGSNGVKEELLTGDTASKVTAAALAAQPGATIERVETDAEGAVYEAHILKADGSHATLKFDSSFNVTATENGFGNGHGFSRGLRSKTQTQ